MARQRAFDRYIEAHGRPAFEQAVSGGQYHDPEGPFYGGVRPSHGRLAIEDLIRHYQLSRRQLAVVDLHTGLGEWAHGEVICDHPPGSSGAATAVGWYGQRCTLPALGSSSSVPKRGLMDYAWHAIMGPDSCFVTLEFGSYATVELFDVLLRDHQFWARYGAQAPGHPERAAMVDALLAHFCPADAAWRQRVLEQARATVDQALRGLSS